MPLSSEPVYLDAPPPRRPLFSGNHLRIGAFGATRPLKNFMSAAGAAVEVAAALARQP
jgi:hypothetical protein